MGLGLFASRARWTWGQAGSSGPRPIPTRLALGPSSSGFKNHSTYNSESLLMDSNGFLSKSLLILVNGLGGLSWHGAFVGKKMIKVW